MGEVQRHELCRLVAVKGGGKKKKDTFFKVRESGKISKRVLQFAEGTRTEALLLPENSR